MQNLDETLVADQQHKYCKQVIHKTDPKLFEQLVGDLWSTGGLSHLFSYGEEAGCAYAPAIRQGRSILPNSIIGLRKS